MPIGAKAWDRGLTAAGRGMDRAGFSLPKQYGGQARTSYASASGGLQGLRGLRDTFAGSGSTRGYGFDAASKGAFSGAGGYSPTRGGGFRGLANAFAGISGSGGGSYVGGGFSEGGGAGTGSGSGTGSSWSGGYGKLTNAGGSWAALDVHNDVIAPAATINGVPENLIKSMLNRESSGDWDGNNRVHTGFRNQRMLPFVGIFESAADSWGLDFDGMIGNRAAQVDGMAKILKGLSDQYGGFENAALVYFGGPDALTAGGFTDELGMNSGYYGQKAIEGWRYLDGLAGTSVPGSPGSWIGGGGMGANAVVAKAQEYLGVPYVWGAIPGQGDDPRATGWDCSGFTYWLDQNYGNGDLPMGSHFQYQYAKDTGQLSLNWDAMQPGDLIFFDTGWQGGGGAEMNKAGHVGMYIGNNQMINANNASTGTIISDLGYYRNQYIGSLRMSWSGGTGGGPTSGGGGNVQTGGPFSYLNGGGGGGGGSYTAPTYIPPTRIYR